MCALRCGWASWAIFCKILPTTRPGKKNWRVNAGDGKSSRCNIHVQIHQHPRKILAQVDFQLRILILSSLGFGRVGLDQVRTKPIKIQRVYQANRDNSTTTKHKPYRMEADSEHAKRQAAATAPNVTKLLLCRFAQSQPYCMMGCAPRSSRERFLAQRFSINCDDLRSG